MTNEQIEQLKRPLDKSNVSQREQSGMKLSYIEGHHAIREANRIFGFDGWDRNTEQMTCIQCEQKGEKQNWYIGYTCKSRILVGTIVREGVGFGQGIDRDLGKAHESAIKESETDAMKRALMTFGDPFGLALYDKKQEHVTDGSNGASDGYVKPAPIDKSKVSPEEQQRNALLYWNRVIFAGKDLKLKVNQEESKAALTKVKTARPDDYISVLLDAEQEDCSTVEQVLEYIGGLK